MENNANKYITVSYELYVDNDGKEVMMDIAKLAQGDAFDFVIPVAEAYGEIDPEHILELPKDFFVVDGKFDSERVFAGNVLPMLNSDGNRLNGTVVEVKDNVVVMDFNHPFAGKDLHFVGTVTESRPATNAEIQEVINMFAGEGCGGGCDCCGGGCGSDDCGDDCGCGEHGHHHDGCGCGCHS